MEQNDVELVEDLVRLMVLQRKHTGVGRVFDLDGIKVQSSDVSSSLSSLRSQCLTRKWSTCLWRTIPSLVVTW